eukprot:s196_g3.t1
MRQIAELERLEPLLSGPWDARRVEVALRPFCETWGSKPRHATHLLDVLAKRKEAILAEEIFWCMWKWRLKVSAFECSAVISAYEKASKWELALEFLQRIPRALCLPNLACFNAAINACAKGGQWTSASFLLEEVRHRLLRPNPITLGSVISGGGCGWATALRLLDGPVDAICWNGAISAGERTGEWTAAAHLLRCMDRSRWRPDSVSYNAAGAACVLTSGWEESLKYVEEMVKHRFLEPTVITYNSCITCCGAAGRWLKAALLFGSLMPRATLRPSMISRCALLTACEKVRGWPKALSSFDDFSRCKAGEPLGLVMGARRLLLFMIT